MNDAPSGLVLSRLSGAPSEAAARARSFCLETIREFYGFEYRADWHADLDSLLLDDAANHYSPANRGDFWFLQDKAGEMIATAGIRHLGWKPGISAMFPHRYPKGDDIASLWRVYVRRDRRGGGIGRWFASLAENRAAALGFGTMYLHATSDAAATLAFWRSAGYREIADIDASTHFDKPLEVFAHH